MHSGIYFLPQKPIAVFLFILIITTLVFSEILLPYKTAQAQWAVFDAANAVWNAIKYVYDKVAWAISQAYQSISAAWAIWNKADTWLVRALKAAWNILRKKLLDMLVDDIIKWIQGGGTPRLVTDWQGFLRSAANQAGGQFVDEYLKMGFLCQRFDARLYFALRAVPTFDTAARCTLSQIGANIDAFFSNFANGGWKGWIIVNEAPNNVYGAYLMALDKKIGIQAEGAEAAKNEAIASSGFLGDKRCTSIYEKNDPSNTGDFKSAPLKESEIPAGWTCSNWTVYTPGKIAAEATVEAANLDIKWLISADEFEEYLGAIIDAVINRMVREGVTKLTTPSGGSAGQTGAGISYAATAATAASANISNASYQDALQNGNAANSVIPQLNLFKENLSAYSSQLQTNLGVLNQIRNVQANGLDVLRQILSSGCPLPAGVTQTVLSTQTTGNCATACPCTMTVTTTYRISAPGVGEMTVQQTTTERRDEGVVVSGPGSMPPPGTRIACQLTNSTLPRACSSFSVCSTTATPYQTISSTTAVDSEVTNVSNVTATVQTQLNTIDTAIADVQNYSQAADKYQKTYEAVQMGSATEQQLSADEAAMLALKSKATSSLQAALNSSSSDLQTLLQEAQNASLQIVQTSGDAQLRRGVISDCAYVQGGTYYADLCTAQTNQTNYQNALNSCLTPTPWG